MSPAGDLCGSFSRAAFETAIEAEFRAGLREFISTTTERHYRDLVGEAGSSIIRSISSIVAP